MTSITKFYSGLTILVTGGTGFMGKVLLEKILRSLLDIEIIYVLLREKKGVNPDDRIRALTSAAPFTLNNINPENFKKVIALHGDITKDNLGLSDKDRQKIIEEVSVVFHLAASVRMNMNLRDAVRLNTSSTHKILNLCTEIKNLKAVVHLSTAYCNVDVEHVEEKIYNTRLNPYKIIDLVEWMDDESLEAIQENILKPHPNTYTFSKRLAEIIAWDMGNKLPLCIARPSIVTPSYKEPALGWNDNFNGPTGLFVAAGKGILQSMLADANRVPQVTPVDLAINALLIMASIRATENFNETPIYNITQADLVPVSWNYVIETLRLLVWNYPFKKMLWYPGCTITNSVIVHKLKVFFFHMIPAYIIDFVLFSCLQEPFLVNIQNRLNEGIKFLSYFALRKFTFTNENMIKLIAHVNLNDQESFSISYSNIDANEYLKNTIMGTKRFCLKEDSDFTWLGRIIMRMLYILDCILKLSFYYALIWLVLIPFELTHIMTWNYWFQVWWYNS